LGKSLTADDLITMQIHGVSTKLAGRMKEKMGGELTADQLVDRAIHGTPEGAR
jgi:hypothetical protein